MSDLNECWLERLRDMKRQQGEVPEGWVYEGIEDFVLQHGVWYRPTGWPPRQGAPKSCFGNAVMNAALYGVKYIEGMALPGMTFINGVPLPSLSGPRRPIHHAWNLDVDGQLCDNTWMNKGLAYIGVEFSVGRADNATWFDDASVLDNPRSRKLYRQPWTGENYNLVWRKSKALRLLRNL
jgi:hypothetical protein